MFQRGPGRPRLFAEVLTPAQRVQRQRDLVRQELAELPPDQWGLAACLKALGSPAYTDQHHAAWLRVGVLKGFQ